MHRLRGCVRIYLKLPSSNTHHLTSGWNLIGFPNLDRITVSSGDSVTLLPRVVGLRLEDCLRKSAFDGISDLQSLTDELRYLRIEFSAMN